MSSVPAQIHAARASSGRCVRRARKACQASKPASATGVTTAVSLLSAASEKRIGAQMWSLVRAALGCAVGARSGGEIEGQRPQGKACGKDVRVRQRALHEPDGIDGGEQRGEHGEQTAAESLTEPVDREQSGGGDQNDQRPACR